MSWPRQELKVFFFTSLFSSIKQAWLPKVSETRSGPMEPAADMDRQIATWLGPYLSSLEGLVRLDVSTGASQNGIQSLEHDAGPYQTAHDSECSHGR